jgi:L-fuconolactonase
VFCKLSGMVTEADWAAWHPQDFHPYLDVVLEMFGTTRLMVGSDWPVSTCAASYAATINVVVDWATKLSSDEREAILGGTCHSFYNLGRTA